MRKTMDFTEGSISSQIIRFALPLFATSLIQQLYNTVDLLYVGNAVGKVGTAAVGASSLLTTCLVGFFGGVSVGMSVITAKAIGARDAEKFRRALQTALPLSALVGLIIMLAGIIGAPVFMRWIRTPEAAFEQSVLYLRIYFLSIIPLITYNMCSGIIRAMGNSRAPMIMQLIGGLTNVAADGVFILLFENDVAGVAWATMLTQTVSALLAVRWLMKGTEHGQLRLSESRLHGDVVREVVRLGVPAGLQTLVIALSNVFVQAKVNLLGVDATAAFATYLKVELPNYLPIVAFGQTIMTFTGQNIGAGRLDRIRKGVKVCIAIGICYVLVSSTLLQVFGRQAFGLFDKNPKVIEYGLQMIRITFPFYFLYVILEVLADAVRGAGKTMPPMLIILANICVLRTVLLFTLTSFMDGIKPIAITYPSAWLATVICITIYWLRGTWAKGADRISA